RRGLLSGGEAVAPRAAARGLGCVRDPEAVAAARVPVLGRLLEATQLGGVLVALAGVGGRALALHDGLRFEEQDFALAGRDLAGELCGLGVFGLVGGPGAVAVAVGGLRAVGGLGC